MSVRAPEAVEQPRFNADRLRRAAQEDGYTQMTLALAVGSNVSTVQSWMLGKAAPSSGRLIKLSEVLGRRPEWFFAADNPTGPVAA